MPKPRWSHQAFHNFQGFRFGRANSGNILKNPNNLSCHSDKGQQHINRSPLKPHLEHGCHWLLGFLGLWTPSSIAGNDAKSRPASALGICVHSAFTGMFVKTTGNTLPAKNNQQRAGRTQTKVEVHLETLSTFCQRFFPHLSARYFLPCHSIQL